MLKALPDDEEADAFSHRQGHGVAVVKALGISTNLLLLIAIAPVLSLDAGVQVGDRVKWVVRTDWSSEAQPAAPPGIIEFMQGIQTIEAYVRRADHSILTYDLTSRFRSGAARTPQPCMNLSSGALLGGVSPLSRTGIPGLGACFVPSGLRMGDSFSIWWRGKPRSLVVNGLKSGRFAGAARQVITANHTSSSGNSTETLSGKWDRSTGILCEATFALRNSTSSLEASIHILETNRWGLAKGSTQSITLVLLIVVLATSVLISRRWFLRRRKQDGK